MPEKKKEVERKMLGRHSEIITPKKPIKKSQALLSAEEKAELKRKAAEETVIIKPKKMEEKAEKEEKKVEIKKEEKPKEEKSKEKAEEKKIEKEEKKPEEEKEVKEKPKEKVEEKKEKKAEEKPKEEKAKVKEEKKPEPKEKVFVEVSETVKERKALKQKRIKLPTIRGRFGKRFTRKPCKKKWQKWRKPRGIDIYRKREDGAWPKTGFESRKEIKGVHPSGFEEVLVFNVNDLTKVNKELAAARIASTVGLKKRKEILAKADTLKLKVLNR